MLVRLFFMSLIGITISLANIACERQGAKPVKRQPATAAKDPNDVDLKDRGGIKNPLEPDENEILLKSSDKVVWDGTSDVSKDLSLDL